MRCVMDIKMLTNRYSTPMYIKVIGTLLFPLVFILMVAIPVFEMIPLDQYAKVFNFKGEATGSYSADTYTIFGMLNIDYPSGAALGFFMTFSILAVICGIAFLWMNRAKLAAAPMAVLFITVIFSLFRSPTHFYNGNEAYDFWNKLYTAGLQTRGTIDQNDTDYFIHQYTVDGKDYIWSRLGQYWVLWVAALVLLAFSIVAIVKTKTLIEKKK